MNTPETGLDITSRRIFIALAKQLENNQIIGWRAVYAKTVLWYYLSPLALIPDFIPGLGFIENFFFSQIALWICDTNPDTVETEDILLFEQRISKILSNTNESIVTTTDTRQEK